MMTRRGQLIDHLEGLRKLDSRQLMMRQKFDELEHRTVSNTDLAKAKSLLPSHQEIEDWCGKGVSAFEDVEVVVAGTKEFPNSLWTTIRVHASSMEMSEGPGRGSSWFCRFHQREWVSSTWFLFPP